MTDRAKTEKSLKFDSDMEEALKKLKERCKRTVLRKLDSEEVIFDGVKKIFVYNDTKEEFKTEVKKGAESEEDSNESDSDSDEDDKAKNKKKAVINKKEVEKSEVVEDKSLATD